MHIARLSTMPASTLRCKCVRFYGLHLRHLHSSPRMQTATRPREIPAEWLRRIVEDGAKPPTLYAWTPKNLAVEGGTSRDFDQGSYTEDTVNALGNSDVRRRIYILGIGNIGRLYAMCLSKLTNRPPITLVVHRRELLERWAAAPGISLTRYGVAHKNSEFDIEWWTEEAPRHGDVAEVVAGQSIPNLIAATKASDAMPQVDRVRRYLGSNSAVAFAQNGMCKLWPPLGDAYVRARFPDVASPHWVACVTTHGVTSQGPFKSTHASPADALVGPVMPGGGEDQAGRKQAEYLIRQIASAPDLDAREVSRKELWVAQLEKLVVNATINPLTAVLRCKNGELFAAREDALPAIMDKLLSEASELLSALVMSSKSDEILNSEPVCQGVIANDPADGPPEASREQLLERFSFPRLRKMILDVGAKVGENTSSMLQDVRAGKATEIDDFNGWLVDTARLLGQGLRLPTHEKLITLVKYQVTLNRIELCEALLNKTS
ncbi:ketoisovalerate reductase [Nemania sp. FL0916]|nr:ketoisovalerate reductase [Nemania sp. FL0916]